MKHVLLKFFSVQHQFKIDPVHINLSDKVLLIIALCLILIALGIRVASLWMKDRLFRNLILRYYHLTLTIGLLELVWYALRFEVVPFFGSHIVAYVILLIGVVWSGFIKWYWWKVYPVEREKIRKQQVKQKYL